MNLENRNEMLLDAKKKLSKAGDAKTAYNCVKKLFDEGTFVETAAYVKARVDTLGMSDASEYEGVVTGYGAIDGRLTFAYIQDMSRQNGSFGKAAAEKICALFDMAKKNGAPVISVLNSAGARLHEGLDTLSGYGMVMKKAARMKGKIPVISLILGNAAGSAAVIAAMSDFIIMSDKNGLFTATPASVLAEMQSDKKIGQAKYCAENRMIAARAADEDGCFAKLRELLEYLPSNRLDKNIYHSVADDANRKTPEIADIVSKEAYDAREVIAVLSDGGKYFEVYSEASHPMVCALSSINNIVCGIVANSPDTHNGKLGMGSLSKAAAFIRLCDSFGIPVVTLCDSEGFNEGCESRKGRVLENSAALAEAYATASVPLVTLNIGAAYGAAFTLMGSKAVGADIAFALPTSKISVMNPDSAVSFMWNDRLKKNEKREDLKEEWMLKMSSPLEAAYLGYVDDIIDPSEARMRIAAALEMLSMKKDFEQL